ncbi:MAG: caspase family protein [Spirochaetaceae bacterium]|nr:caspase family protein [Spirochaetaceae bacterium]
MKKHVKTTWFRPAVIALVFLAATARLWCGGKGEAPSAGTSPAPRQTAASGVPVTGGGRFALVIGNADYKNIEKLTNTVNDARDIAAALKGLGFEVDLRLNLGEMQFGAAIDSYVKKLAGDSNSEGFFWYAGHGVQIRGQNYLLPVDANIESERTLQRNAFSLDELLADLGGAHNKVNVVILDACRNNPLPSSARGAATRGLVAVQDVPADLFVMFSTAPGDVAEDGQGKRNSPFAEAFLKHITTPDPLALVAPRITRETVQLTGNRQQPFFRGSIISDEYYSLNPVRPAVPMAAAPAPAAAAPATVVPAAQPVAAPAARPAPANQPAAVPTRPAAPPVTAPSVQPGQLLRTLSGHTHYVLAVAFSSDGRRIVSGSYNDTVKVWDVETGVLIRTLSGHTSSVNSVAFSPDGRRIVSGSQDNTIKVWNAENGTLIRTLSHSDWILSVAFSPDGRRIVSGAQDNTIKVWNAETGALIRTLSGHGNNVFSVTFSSDGRRIVSGSWDDTVKVWNAETGTLIRTLSGHTNRVRSVAFSPDGRRIVSGANDKNIKVWNAETGTLIRTLSGHGNAVTSVAFSPDGWRIVSGSYDNTIKVWNAETGALIRTLSGHRDVVMSVAFSPDGRRIVSGSQDNTIKVWDAGE